ncbi:brct domain containing protein [Drepanopeziza brunnea f. sp. 'multigermtubi' MB_m1]|uniref:Brct domain containing protein n=1 Tax=Marssonina brunnea f. sp. multigermtubi (strain MB_m1) TaxID=1072389 RepID=K1WMB7_MARBU|nr:brct domain containing protein [Drepanopeziza brunnea f. sp. 'multigermtubi' MB_m1]EKD14011.1 brct domain containing protein [Drepanopeziza brunnea f. sp. 'multigermtubi' MB_m1]
MQLLGLSEELAGLTSTINVSLYNIVPEQSQHHILRHCICPSTTAILKLHVNFSDYFKMPTRQSLIASRATSNNSKRAARTNAPIKEPAPAPLPIVQKVKSGRRMRQIFKGLTMTSVGTYPGSNKVLTGDDVRNFVTAHGGIYEREVTAETTHLICSIEEYKKRPKHVCDAWQLGTERCKIVVFDWLEDCLVRKQKLLLSTRPYTLDRTIMQLRKRNAKDMTEYRKKFEDGVKVSKELCDNRLYHVYYDADAFEYKVMLSRFRLDGSTMIEKYTLFLFESHAKAPPLYMFGAKFSRTHRPTSYYREDCHPMVFSTAFNCFKKFFREKSGVDWDLRLERLSPKTDAHGNEKVFFKYSPPAGGRPVGLLPPGYVRPDDRPLAQPVDAKAADIIEVYDTDSEADSDNDGDGDESGSASSQTPTQTSASSSDHTDESGSISSSSSSNTARPDNYNYDQNRNPNTDNNAGNDKGSIISISSDTSSGEGSASSENGIASTFGSGNSGSDNMSSSELGEGEQRAKEQGVSYGQALAAKPVSISSDEEMMQNPMYWQ